MHWFTGMSVIAKKCLKVATHITGTVFTCTIVLLRSKGLKQEAWVDWYVDKIQIGNRKLLLVEKIN